MKEILQEWDKYKYIEFKPSDEVFEFLNLAKVNTEDVLARFEAIGFYHGYKCRENQWQ